MSSPASFKINPKFVYYFLSILIFFALVLYFDLIPVKIALSWNIRGDLADRDSNEDPADRDFNEIHRWIKSFQPLFAEDKRRSDLMMRTVTGETSLDEIRGIFYEAMNFPVQSACNMGKFFGGVWGSKYGCIDGHKFICLDNFYEDVKSGNCLIYSFGIDHDWSFEEIIASMGCRIKTYDPTVDGSDKPANDLISFERLGIGAVTTDSTSVGPVATFKDIVTKNGDYGKTITYFKVDVEGMEIDAFADWIDSGMMRYVKQIGIEMHTGMLTLSQDKMLPALNKLLDAFRKLHEMGFELVSTQDNGCAAKSFDYENRYNTYFEIVLYKP